MLDKKRQRHHGFTLLELVMVIIILGILVSMAHAAFLKITERARQVEAFKFLGQVRNALLRYYAEKGIWLQNDSAFNDIDIENPNGSVSELFFTYHIGDSPQTPKTDLCYAERNNVAAIYEPYVIAITANDEVLNTMN